MDVQLGSDPYPLEGRNGHKMVTYEKAAVKGFLSPFWSF